MIHQASANAADSAGGILHLRFNGASISWGGQGSFPDELCFGTEDGQLLFTTVDGVQTRPSIAGGADPEAVNGAAFIGPIIAISNRREIEFCEPGAAHELAERAIFPHGAHEVIAAHGFFIAPLGPSGLMMANAGQGKHRRVTVSQASHQTLNYYKVVDVRVHGGPSLLACAVRHGGIALVELAEDGRQAQMRSLTFPGLDVVDVCSLGAGEIPPAVAALDRNGTLVFLSNPLNNPSPTSVKFPTVTGVAYRVFCVGGNILMLTSTGLYILARLASRFLAGEPVDSTPTEVRGIPLEAVDADVCWNRWLVVVLPDDVLRFDLLADGFPAGGSTQAEPSKNPVLISPVWEFHQGPMTVST